MPLLHLGRAFVRIYRNFFYKRNPFALTAMLLFLVGMFVVQAVRLIGDPLFWFGVGVVAFSNFVAIPAIIYIIDTGHFGGRRRRATQELLDRMNIKSRDKT